MSLPTTDAELKIIGYIKMDDAVCRGCFALITWYRTPKGKMMPFDRHSLLPHHATCPKVAQFRGAKHR